MRYTERKVNEKVDVFDCLTLGLAVGFGIGIGNGISETKGAEWPWVVGTYLGTFLLAACINATNELFKRLANKVFGEYDNE